MIEWKVYDRNNPPEFDKLFLINHPGGVTSGYADRADNGRISWFSYNGNMLPSVTHYAEINLPGQRGGLVNPDGGDYPLKWMSQRRVSDSGTNE